MTTTTSSGPDIAAIASQVATVDELVLKFFPYVSTVIALIPGAQVAAPVLPVIGAGLMAIDNAAKLVAAGNPGMAFEQVIQTIVDHLTPGKPNSPILSAPAAAPAP